MKPYPAYKNPSLPWLERIPAGWEALPNIALFDERIERGFITEELLSVTQDRGIIKQSELEEKKDSSNEDKSAYKRVRVGDIAYNKMRMWQGAVGHSPFEGIVSPAYIVLKSKRRFNPRYYHYLFRTPTYMRESYRNSYGICDDQLSLRFFNFKRMQSIIPPIEEQDSIVAFLEAKEWDIQTYIANKRRIIELLKEQKTVLINRAVTRGLNPNAPLKPSGILWLSDIPKHWHVFRIRSLIRSIDQGISPISEEGLADDEHWGVLKSGCVNGGVFRAEEHKRLRANFLIDPQIVVREGDVLVSRASGSVKLVGSTARVTKLKHRLVLSDKTFRLNFRDPRIIDFAVLAMNSWYYRKQLESVLSGAEGLPNNLPQSELRDLALALPPTDEAEAIYEAITESSLRNEQAVATAEREIAFMEEYRTALIAAAVTGKIDVRSVNDLD